MKLRRLPYLSLILLLSAVMSEPLPSFAGGGGNNLKGTKTIRIKNTSSGITTPPSMSLATVEVGDAGNSPLVVNSMSFGAVASAYRIGKYEVTIDQYAAFLNSVATRPDIYSYGPAVIESLYDSRMQSDKNVAGIARSGSGTAQSPYSYQVVGDGTRPITYVTLFNAARFANWIENGARSDSELEHGVYHLFGDTSGVLTKAPGATWWIPSEDEWFKAAYYKGGGTNTGYFRYPTSSDSLPGNSSDTAANQANFLRLGVYATTQLTTLSSAENYLTPAGNFSSSPSPYGTFDQGGNVDEWVDAVRSTQFGTEYVTRGGGWNTGGLNNDASPESTALPHDRSNKIGFRLARSAAGGGGAQVTGVFIVEVLNNGTLAPRSLSPNAVTQFSVRNGSVTIKVTDSGDPSVTAQKTLSIGSSRTVHVTAALVNGQISIQTSPTPF